MEKQNEVTHSLEAEVRYDALIEVMYMRRVKAAMARLSNRGSIDAYFSDLGKAEGAWRKAMGTGTKAKGGA